MGFAWKATVSGVEDMDTCPSEFEAYHLEDLLAQVQFMFWMRGLFRVDLIAGDREVTVEEWAELLAYDYENGYPENTRQEYAVTIRNGNVIVTCN